ncbi:hypothetical protein BS47DRAFT_1369468 [Hydnum rufescens UP504]|uniref:Uncharacterized protein n=1 Tax=Hydnum rufescens UP504 TaxID=1448309 RepID=A0A9P6ACU7_9AGAM|nr:hypothetical protein BS47DRAFT_1369468 [Hydnum rufescens UP504]
MTPLPSHPFLLCPGQSQCLALFAAPPPEASAKGGVITSSPILPYPAPSPVNSTLSKYDNRHSLGTYVSLVNESWRRQCVMGCSSGLFKCWNGYMSAAGWAIVQWSIVHGVGLEYKYSLFDLGFGVLAGRNTPFQRDIMKWSRPLYSFDGN